MYIKRILISMISVLMVTLSIGCGGDSSSGSSTPASINISGVAAAGAPIIGVVYIRDAAGAQKSTFIEADGSYTIDVRGMTAPYKLRSVGYVGNQHVSYCSYAESSDEGGTVNITPFTDLILANAAGQLANSFFESNSATITSDDLTAQKEALRTKLQTAFTQLGVSDTIDLLRTSFNADHSGLDAALDMIRVDTNTTSNIATITNLIDNTTITDDIEDLSDNNTSLVVTSDLSVIASDYQLISSLLTNLTTAYTNAIPSPTTLQTYFADTFLADDMSKSYITTQLLQLPFFKDAKFTGAVIKDLTATDATLTSSIIFTNGEVLRGIIWSVKKIDGAWVFNGNQKVVETDFSYGCSRHQQGAVNTATFSVDFSSENTSCGMWMQVEDLDNTNNGSNIGAIVKAKVSIVDKDSGADILGYTFNLDDTAVAGTLLPDYDGNNDDYVVYLDSDNTTDPSFTNIYNIDPKQHIVKFELYDNYTASGTPKVTYTDSLLGNIPTLPNDNDKLPKISTIKYSFVGSMDITWLLPSNMDGLTATTYRAKFTDISNVANYAEVEEAIMSNTQTSGTLSGNLGQWPSGTVLSVEVAVDYQDIYGVTYNTYAYHYVQTP